MTRSSLPIAWLTALVVTTSAVSGVAWQGITREPTAPAVSDSSAQAQETLPEVSLEGSAPPGEPAQLAEPLGDRLLVPQYSPWAPGATFNLTREYPQPGVPFSASECTVAFSFSGSDGRMYAVTASHCGSQGDLIFPRDGETIEDYTSELGRVIWSGLDEPSPSGDPERRPDVAIIQISNPDRLMVAGGEPPGETVLASPQPGVAEACKIGGTTGRTCGALGPRDQRYVMVDPDSDMEVRSVGDTASMCAQRGDSGGPVLAEVGGRQAIIGLVSGTRADAEDAAPDCNGDGIDSAAGSIAYATSEQIMVVINQVVPDALFSPAS